MKRKILIASPAQFGYSSTGYPYFCRRLKGNFEIDFLCIDKGWLRVSEPGINIIYVRSTKSKIKTILNLTRLAIRLSYQENYAVLFCLYYRVAFFVGLLARSNLKILDIRTGSIIDNGFCRKMDNTLMLLTSLSFDKTAVVSRSLADILKLPSKKTTVLPQGSEVIDRSTKKYDRMHLIYVGTLHKRHIEKTIEGFAIFYKKYSGKISIRYDILGFSNRKADSNKIFSAIEKHNLEETVLYHGRKTHQEMQQYFKESTIGVCFVPRTSFYNVQPSTKIFEYALSGLITIATETYENCLLINDTNGVICQDNPEGFCAGLEKIYSNLPKYNELQIRNSLANFHWDNIINTTLLPLLVDARTRF